MGLCAALNLLWDWSQTKQKMIDDGKNKKSPKGERRSVKRGKSQDGATDDRIALVLYRRMDDESETRSRKPDVVIKEPPESINKRMKQNIEIQPRSQVEMEAYDDDDNLKEPVNRSTTHPFPSSLRARAESYHSDKKL